MKKRAWLAAILAAALMLGTLAGCGNGSESGGNTGSAGEKDTLVFVSHMSSESFDTINNTMYDKNVMHQVYDTLTAFDNEGNIIPNLAESWEETEDNHGYIFHLRQDVKFHDGTDFNADAVIFTLQALKETTANAWLFSSIGEFSKIDDYTVRIDKANASCKLLNFLAEYPFIVSPTAYESDPEHLATKPVGTGAYVFNNLGSDGYVYLDSNPDYFKGEPYYKHLVIRTPLDSNTAVVALQNGEVDIAIALAANQMPIVEQDDSLVAEINDAWSLKYVLMEGERFQNDENLRKAVYYAINRENAIIYNNEPEDTPVATDFFAQRIMGDYAGQVDVGGYDPELAAEYLAQSNYDGGTIQITISQDLAALAQSVQADLSAIGINTEIVQVDMNAYYAAMQDGTCEMSIADLGTDYLSPEDMLSYYTSSGTYGPYVYTTDEYDALYNQAIQIWDDEERAPLTLQLIEMQVDFANLVPLYESNFNYVYRAGLTGFNPISGGTYVYYLGDVKPVDAQ